MSDATKAVYERLDALLNVPVYGLTLPPDSTFPCAVYGQIFGGEGVAVSGGDSTYRMRFQIDLYHPSFDGVLALRDTVIAGMHRWSGEGGILDTRIDLDLPYVADEMDLTQPALFRHIIDIGIDVKRDSA